jgi:hypothetical protein
LPKSYAPLGANGHVRGLWINEPALLYGPDGQSLPEHGSEGNKSICGGPAENYVGPVSMMWAVPLRLVSRDPSSLARR